jgi:hypothetical protein
MEIAEEIVKYDALFFLFLWPIFAGTALALSHSAAKAPVD